MHHEVHVIYQIRTSAKNVLVQEFFEEEKARIYMRDMHPSHPTVKLVRTTKTITQVELHV